MAATNNDDRLTNVEKDASQLSVLFEKLDTSVEKLTSISADLTRLLAVHENRITYHERSQAQLEEKFDKRYEATDARFGKIYDRIDEVKQEVLKEITDNNNKIANVEKWMWTCFGGGAVIFFILSHVPIHI